MKKKVRIILPDGSCQKVDAGNVMTLAAQNTDAGVFLRGLHKSQVNIWCWPVGSGEVWGYRTNPAFDEKVHAGVSPRVKADKAIGDWNTFHIIMKGDHRTVTLYDKRIIYDAQLPGVPRQGPLALQLHPERKDDEWGGAYWCSFAIYVSRSWGQGSGWSMHGAFRMAAKVC